MLSNIAENNYMFKDNNNRNTETTEAIEKWRYFFRSLSSGRSMTLSLASC